MKYKNPILIFRELITNPKYGLGIKLTQEEEKSFRLAAKSLD